MSELRTWKRTQRQVKHLTAREQRLLALYDQALLRDEWRADATDVRGSLRSRGPSGRPRPAFGLYPSTAHGRGALAGRGRLARPGAAEPTTTDIQNKCSEKEDVSWHP
jgi:hypothetical protein